MKKFTGFLLLLIVVCAYLWSCEKDDICPEGTNTTPNLVVELYNFENRELEAVDSLRYFVEGMTDTIKLANTETFSLPLPVDRENVKWGLTLGTRITGGYSYNTDYLEFSYTTQEEYISRACGFRDTFTLEPSTNLEPNPALTDSPDAEGTWIDDIEVETRFIVTEQDDEVHLKIYY